MTQEKKNKLLDLLREYQRELQQYIDKLKSQPPVTSDDFFTLFVMQRRSKAIDEIYECILFES